MVCTVCKGTAKDGVSGHKRTTCPWTKDPLAHLDTIELTLAADAGDTDRCEELQLLLEQAEKMKSSTVVKQPPLVKQEPHFGLSTAEDSKVAQASAAVTATGQATTLDLAEMLARMVAGVEDRLTARLEARQVPASPA